MIYQIEISRSGISENTFVFYKSFKKEPSKDQILQLIQIEDIKFNSKFCLFKFHKL